MTHSRPLFSIFLLVAFNGPAFAAQSSIVDAEGTACMGDDRSRKQTEQAALTNAKKRAVEHVATYLKSETEVKNFSLEGESSLQRSRMALVLLRGPRSSSRTR